MKVIEEKVTGVKRQLVLLCYHSVNRSDESEDMNFIIVLVLS